MSGLIPKPKTPKVAPFVPPPAVAAPPPAIPAAALAAAPITDVVSGASVQDSAAGSTSAEVLRKKYRPSKGLGSSGTGLSV